MITAKVEGLEELLRGLGAMEAEIPVAVDAYLVGAAERVRADVKRNTPVDTGALRRNTKATRVFGNRKNRRIRIYNPVEYAQYVEFDTRTVDKKRVIKGRYMFRNAYDRHRKLRDSRINKFLGRIVKAGGFD